MSTFQNTFLAKIDRRSESSGTILSDLDCESIFRDKAEERCQDSEVFEESFADIANIYNKSQKEGGLFLDGLCVLYYLRDLYDSAKENGLECANGYDEKMIKINQIIDRNEKKHSKTLELLLKSVRASKDPQYEKQFHEEIRQNIKKEQSDNIRKQIGKEFWAGLIFIFGLLVGLPLVLMGNDSGWAFIGVFFAVAVAVVANVRVFFGVFWKD
jgi:hypothetical protein